MAKRIIRFQNVSLGYGRRLVLEGLTFEIRRGDFLGIIGPNGAGKTTLLRGILGLIGPRVGHISVTDKLQYGYVMQRHFLDTLFPFTVNDVVRMGRLGRKRSWERLDQEDHRQVEEALETSGLIDLRDQLCRELSGGQKQRWMIWEGEPMQTSVEKLASSGIQSLVFDPCGNVPEEGDFLSVMQQNVRNLEAAFH